MITLYEKKNENYQQVDKIYERKKNLMIIIIIIIKDRKMKKTEIWIYITVATKKGRFSVKSRPCKISCDQGVGGRFFLQSLFNSIWKLCATFLDILFKCANFFLALFLHNGKVLVQIQ